MKQNETNNQNEQDAREGRSNILGNENEPDSLTQKEKDSLEYYHKSQNLTNAIVDMYNNDAELTPACVMMAFGFFIACLERGCEKEHRGEVFAKALSLIGKGYTLDKILQREVDEGKDANKEG